MAGCLAAALLVAGLIPVANKYFNGLPLQAVVSGLSVSVCMF